MGSKEGAPNDSPRLGDSNLSSPTPSWTKILFFITAKANGVAIANSTVQTTIIEYSQTTKTIAM